MKYSYPLDQSIVLDYSTEQWEELLSQGYVFNESEKTYDLYEEKIEEREYVDFTYSELVSVESELREYQISEQKKVINVKYKIVQQTEGLLGFFKKAFNSFFYKTEENINKSREDELDLLLEGWEIRDLQKIEVIKLIQVRKILTDKEIEELRNKWMKYSFIRNTWEKRNEKISITKEKTSIPIDEYQSEYENTYDCNIFNRYKKKEIVEKLVVDRRIEMQTIINYYIPGVWSRSWNHKEGTIAEFSCQIIISYISWFNAFDTKFFNKKEVKESIIDIIEKEHPNTIYIRDRVDKKDGFEIENTEII